MDKTLFANRLAKTIAILLAARVIQIGIYDYLEIPASQEEQIEDIFPYIYPCSILVYAFTILALSCFKRWKIAGGLVLFIIPSRLDVRVLGIDKFDGWRNTITTAIMPPLVGLTAGTLVAYN